MSEIDSEYPTKSKKILINDYYHMFDKDTVEYIHTEIMKLEINNWNLFHDETDYAKGKNMAYRECARILTTILNNKLFKSN